MYRAIVLSIVFCIIGCTNSPTKYKNKLFVEGVDFFYDTSLVRDKNLESIKKNITNINVDSIVSVQQVLNKVVEHLPSQIEVPDIFHVNLLNDSIWIIEGKLKEDLDMIYFGGDIHVEIRKKDSFIIGYVLGE